MSDNNKYKDYLEYLDKKEPETSIPENIIASEEVSTYGNTIISTGETCFTCPDEFTHAKVGSDSFTCIKVANNNKFDTFLGKKKKKREELLFDAKEKYNSQIRTKEAKIDEYQNEKLRINEQINNIENQINELKNILGQVKGMSSREFLKWKKRIDKDKKKKAKLESLEESFVRENKEGKQRR